MKYLQKASVFAEEIEGRARLVVVVLVVLYPGYRFQGAWLMATVVLEYCRGVRRTEQIGFQSMM